VRALRVSGAGPLVHIPLVADIARAGGFWWQSLLAMMTMVPVRVVQFPRRFNIKAALPARHPSDALEVRALSITYVAAIFPSLPAVVLTLPPIRAVRTVC